MFELYSKFGGSTVKSLELESYITWIKFIQEMSGCYVENCL